MCGISGCISKNIVDIDSFVKMNQIIKHRGPDDEGFVLFSKDEIYVLGSKETSNSTWNETGNYFPTKVIENNHFDVCIALGHRRLSILDLSAQGHQPMCSFDKRYWIVYNGEIYNYLELRNELLSYGYIFSSESDTEVILAAYSYWGVDCQYRFKGMWAFAIYDKSKNDIFFSRDRFGIKPFYYWYSPSGDFYFASEIKQFTSIRGWKSFLNESRALDFLYFSKTDHTDETLFRGVYSLLPGHYILSGIESIINHSSKLKQKKWYFLKSVQSKISFENAKVVYLNKLYSSIKMHMRADVQIGCALSGGLDSSSIVSLVNLYLKEKNKKELQKTYSSCSYDNKYSEKEWIDEVVNDTKVDANYIYPNGLNIFNLSEEIIWHMDEPYQSQSAFLGFHVFQSAREDNTKVVLNGQGADEYLSCYGVFRYLRIKKYISKLNLFDLKKEPLSFFNLAFLFLSHLFDCMPIYLQKIINALLVKKAYIHKLINKKYRASFRYSILEYHRKRYKNHLEVSINQIFHDPLPRYLRWEDRNSMAHSVEARVPFLDHELVEFVHSLPLNYLDDSDSSKKILVESMQGILNEKVRNRKDKKGFITPEQRWFTIDHKDDFLKMLNTYIRYSKGYFNTENTILYFKKVQLGKLPFDYTYWRILSFCIWMKVYDVQILDD